MNKIIENGKVAVLVSRGYGAGWSTWNPDIEQMVFSPEIVRMVIDNEPVERIEKAAKKLWPKAYLGGAEGLSVEWVEEGTVFRIDEYDGAESIETYNRETWIEA